MAADPQLKMIVQRMIDAGEPEENIAAVIRSYKTTPATKSALAAPPSTSTLDRLVTLLPHTDHAADGPHIGPLPANAPVTLGDFQADPQAALNRAYALLKRDVTDPSTWARLAAMYVGPKVIGAVLPPGGAEPTAASPSAPSRMGAAVRAAGPGLGRAVFGYRGQGVMEALKAAAEAARTAGSEGAAASPGTSSATPPSSGRPAPTAAPSPAARPGGAPESLLAAKPQLTLEEFRAAEQLVKQGYDPQDVLVAIQRNRLPQAWRGLPSDADVWSNVETRNETGRWPK